MRFFAPALVATFFACPAFAQDRPNTILVMDGSGSMWGQIDGVAKITIAQDVVGDLLDTLPGEQRLGLTAYGHRARGDCSDIETIVAPAEGTRGAIADAVAGISPLGKTPMTDAVIAAAEALRYTEDSATVILVSDGVETCNPDPCAAARLLEQAGIDFTAHVIGFDVGGDAEARAQMQCIADETGGMFIPAADAGELAQALTTVVEEPEFISADITFRAVLGDENGPLITDPVLWNVASDSGEVAIDERANPFDMSLLNTTHYATAYRLIDELEMQVTVNINDASPQTITVVFPEVAQTATVTGPVTAVAGSTIAVDWDGPNNDRDFIAVGEVGDQRYDNYTYTSEGSPLMLEMPPEPGTYELRYHLREGNEILATQVIEVTAAPSTLIAPDTAEAGSKITVGWDGPDYPRDFISVAEAGERAYINYTYTNEGNPLELLMPVEPGTYELRYQMRQDQTVIATQPITVVKLETQVTAPATAVAGSMVTVDWVGPDYERDFIAVAEIGDRSYENYTYTSEGNPLQLEMPTTPGDYEIRYTLRQDQEVIARQQISVTRADATLDAPQTADIGGQVTVTWTGPDYPRDFISIGKPGETAYDSYTYTSEGNTLTLQMPSEAGDYEIRYQMRQDNAILQRHPISVALIKAELLAPDTIALGETLIVGWDGPDNAGDYIAIAEIGADNRYLNYAYTERGNPSELRLPEAAGDYEIRYYLDKDNTVIGRRPITVTE